MANALRALKSRATCDYVFIKEDGSRYKDWRRAFASAKKRAGIPSGFRFHDLRHTFGTWLTDAEVHPYAIQDLIGHRSNLMTRRYAHVTASHKRTAMKRLPRVGDPRKGREFAPTDAPTQSQNENEAGNTRRRN